LVVVQSPDIGAFIKDLRENARISLRQLAEQANISNPYLSQIERGLRKPSAEVLAQLAAALRVSTPAMYLKAGLLGSDDHHGVPTAIAADPLLTVAQKQSLTQIYETFVRENARAEETATPESAPAAPAEPTVATAKKPTVKKAVKKAVRQQAQEEQ
jgi:transcriptional regulator with XRE-family HTH domain